MGRSICACNRQKSRGDCTAPIRVHTSSLLYYSSFDPHQTSYVACLPSEYSSIWVRGWAGSLIKPTMDFDPDTHPVRITTHGKIKTWVQFALDFLDVRRFLSHCFSCSILTGE